MTEPAMEWVKSLSAPFADSAIKFRQDGKVQTLPSGKHVARFVAYIDATTVRERLDEVAPGEWSYELSPAPVRDDAAPDEKYAFTCRLTVKGVTRTGAGSGRSIKSAATDAFKRAAVEFGIGKQLYSMGKNTVPMSDDSRYAKPLIDPHTNFFQNGGKLVDDVALYTEPAPSPGRPFVSPATEPVGSFAGNSPQRPPSCPKCGGPMWDNRIGKKNPKAPDYKCKDRSCDGVIWPPKGAAVAVPAVPEQPPFSDHDDDDDLPF